MRYITCINDSLILILKKQTWDIELSNVAKDLSDISVAYTHSAEENRKLGIDIETMAGLINDR